MNGHQMKFPKMNPIYTIHASFRLVWSKLSGDGKRGWGELCSRVEEHLLCMLKSLIQFFGISR